MFVLLIKVSNFKDENNNTSNDFEKLLEMASENITEENEGELIEQIRVYYKYALNGDIEALEKTVEKISSLSEINAVLNANLTGDKFRRCSGHEAIDEINGIYSKINMILDKKSAGLESESDR